MSRAPCPTITLTTDFGTSDYFVGALKGVIATIAPHANVVDITHEITPYAIIEGAFVIAQAWKYFPQASIHVVVVDPGVGTSRRPILAEVDGHYFIAPDNGVLTMIYGAGPQKVHVISNPQVMADEVSRTFHGRDVFAPAAAHLAQGMPTFQFGDLISDFIRIGTTPRQLSPTLWDGMVLKADRFGNLITNFHIQHFADIETRAFEIRTQGHRINRLALTFAEGGRGEPVAIVGSSGYIEIAANQGSAASILGSGVGTPIELEIYDAPRS